MKYEVSFRYIDSAGNSQEESTRIEAPNRNAALFTAGYAAKAAGLALGTIKAVTVSQVPESEPS